MDCGACLNRVFVTLLRFYGFLSRILGSFWLKIVRKLGKKRKFEEREWFEGYWQCVYNLLAMKFNNLGCMDNSRLGNGRENENLFHFRLSWVTLLLFLSFIVIFYRFKELYNPNFLRFRLEKSFFSLKRASWTWFDHQKLHLNFLIFQSKIIWPIFKFQIRKLVDFWLKLDFKSILKFYLLTKFL